MKRSKNFQTLKGKLRIEGIHIKIARGDDYHNQIYCSKEDTNAWQYGEPKKQGQRSDLKEVCQAIKEGKDMKTICNEYDDIYAKYWRGLHELKKAIAPPPQRNFKTEVYYYYGAPGVGKLKRAYEEALATGESIYYKPRGDWWDGYHQQPNVIIDDFDGWIEYEVLLKIMDRYPCMVPIKRSYEIFNSKRIWITSNVPIASLYKHSYFLPEAIESRCTSIIEIK